MLGFSVSKGSEQSLQLQVVTGLREAVNSDRLALGERLPPSRQLASEIGVSRNLITAAYEQLIAEGYLEATVGRGTFVTSKQETGGEGNPLEQTPVKTEDREGDFAPIGRFRPRFDFTPGRPDLHMIPAGRWSECLRDSAGRAPSTQWGYGPTEGDRHLREEIAAWLRRIRGISVHPDRITVTSGTAQSLTLLALSGLGEQSRVFHCEDPSIPYAREAFSAAGYIIRSLPVSPEYPEGPRPPGEPGVAYLNPSHRFPRGGTMKAGRRAEFLRWAADTDSIVIEDDYDSEFRYEGTPVEPMLRHNCDRVVYLGTFSKCLFPGLRLGYMILPDRLRTKVSETKVRLMMCSPLIQQKALARFMEQGLLDRHVLKMKQIYRRRFDVIAGALERAFPGSWNTGGTGAGYHISVSIPGKRFDEEFFRRCRRESIAVRGEGHYSFADGIATDRLVIGFGNIRDNRLETGIGKLVALSNEGGSGTGGQIPLAPRVIPLDSES